jgi:DNA topoisomerase VI subunit B
MMAALATLERTTFRTSRLLEFCSRKELVAQTGHEPDAWPLVVLKELVDNALDACEEACVAPKIEVQVGPSMQPKRRCRTISPHSSRPGRERIGRSHGTT